MTTTADLFAALKADNLICSPVMRASVVENVSANGLGFRATLVMDYSTPDKSPGHRYQSVLLGDFLFDGLPAHAYDSALRTGTQRFGVTTELGAEQAMLLAMLELANHPSATCIYRDIGALTYASEFARLPHPGHANALRQLIENSPMYDESSTLCSSTGRVSPERVSTRLSMSIALGPGFNVNNLIAKINASPQHPAYVRLRRSASGTQAQSHFA